MIGDAVRQIAKREKDRRDTPAQTTQNVSTEQSQMQASAAGKKRQVKKKETKNPTCFLSRRRHQYPAARRSSWSRHEPRVHLRIPAPTSMP